MTTKRTLPRNLFTGAAFAMGLAAAGSLHAASETSPTAATWPAAPPPAASTCGNGLVEQAEDCDTCPADCEVHACEPSGDSVTFTVKVVPAPATTPAAVAIRLAYRSARFQIPGSAVSPGVSQRVRSLKPGSQVVANDLDHSLRVVLADSSGLGDGGFEVTFDLCRSAEGDERAGAEDVACWIERCSGSGGAIAGCDCSVTGND